MKKAILCGACGRMGKWVANDAEKQGFKIVCGINPNGKQYADFPVYDSFSQVSEEADVVIDFSLPEALTELLDFITAKKMPAVLCVTGYSEEQISAIEKAAEKTPIFRSHNMSMGVYVLNRLALQAKKLLPDFDIEIIERHHRNKADAPSGTALTLYEALKTENSKPIIGRNEKSGKRESLDIGISAVRGGSINGIHEVCFLGEGENITIEHVAESRSIFATGALKAAAFIINKPPKIYGMEDYFNNLLKL
ncbi:MAG: 4-hydroxy-tetrahydrodipicolinate reductase [Eubacteriales bacterium]|nr:4-hydroxy-tetrahydrodipicolinate reductase [Eubacteriales bacterium]